MPIKRIPFTFIDVGGQRTQREKWFQCFQESINSILFFVAISEFDQTLVEDRQSNRLIESLRVRVLNPPPIYPNTLHYLFRFLNMLYLIRRLRIEILFYFLIKMTFWSRKLTMESKWQTTYLIWDFKAIRWNWKMSKYVLTISYTL